MGMNFNLTVNYSTGCTTAPKTFLVQIVTSDPYEEVGGFGTLSPALSSVNYESFIGAGQYGQIEITLRD